MIQAEEKKYANFGGVDLIISPARNNQSFIRITWSSLVV
jgi:hypothetical protein